jgi:hypothetical protein
MHWAKQKWPRDVTEAGIVSDDSHEHL